MLVEWWVGLLEVRVRSWVGARACSKIRRRSSAGRSKRRNGWVGVGMVFVGCSVAAADAAAVVAIEDFESATAVDCAVEGFLDSIGIEALIVTPLMVLE